MHTWLGFFTCVHVLVPIRLHGLEARLAQIKYVSDLFVLHGGVIFSMSKPGRGGKKFYPPVMHITSVQHGSVAVDSSSSMVLIPACNMQVLAHLPALCFHGTQHSPSTHGRLLSGAARGGAVHHVCIEFFSRACLKTRLVQLQLQLKWCCESGCHVKLVFSAPCTEMVL